MENTHKVAIFCYVVSLIVSVALLAQRSDVTNERVRTRDYFDWLVGGSVASAVVMFLIAKPMFAMRNIDTDPNYWYGILLGTFVFLGLLQVGSLLSVVVLLHHEGLNVLYPQAFAAASLWVVAASVHHGVGKGLVKNKYSAP